MTIGETIKSLRKSKGITQKRLAELTGLATITIQGYEAEKYKPKYEQLKKLSDALNVPIRTFLLEMNETDRVQIELEIYQNNNLALEKLLTEILKIHNYKIEIKDNNNLIITNYRDVRFNVKYESFIDMLSRCDKDIKYNIDKLLDNSERL